jgi:hypothetical protein
MVLIQASQQVFLTVTEQPLAAAVLVVATPQQSVVQVTPLAAVDVLATSANDAGQTNGKWVATCGMLCSDHRQPVYQSAWLGSEISKPQ